MKMIKFITALTFSACAVHPGTHENTSTSTLNKPEYYVMKEETSSGLKKIHVLEFPSAQALAEHKKRHNRLSLILYAEWIIFIALLAPTVMWLGGVYKQRPKRSNHKCQNIDCNRRILAPNIEQYHKLHNITILTTTNRKLKFSKSSNLYRKHCFINTNNIESNREL